ncbi:hypothetical protein [Paraburkholderia sp. D1E]|uniref:hypothetical protein n=1 Tax=Paraburkholderia sp. D1E TaxID=3461398 RepID=UPI0040458EAD
MNDDRVTVLAVLSVAHYIADDRCDEARQRLLDNPDIQFEPCTARQLLDWLIAEKYMDRDDEENATLQNLQWSEDKAVPLDQRIALMLYISNVDPRLNARLQALLELRRKKAKTSFLLQVGGVLVVLIGFGIYMLMPDSTPMCGASSTTTALNSLIYDGEMKSMTGLQMVQKNGLPNTRNHREIGYDSKDHSRGCVADLTIGEDKTQIGYAVLRTADDKNKFAVQAFPPEYITSRYDAATLNNTLGAPVGRDNMEAAMKAALTHLDAQIHGPAALSSKPATDDDQPASLADSVLNVIPSANCRQLADGRQSCPVTIDYRDDLLSAIGASPVIQLHSDFVFVKSGTSWTMADDFPKAFMTAIVAGRMAKLKPTPPVAASEASN